MRVQASLRFCLTFDAPLYIPFLLARRAGLLDEAGIGASVFTASHPDDAAAVILRGEADVCVGGPIDILLHRCRDPAVDLTGFCALVARDPFSLVGRTPPPDQPLAALAACRFRPVTDVETPWLFLKEDLRRLGMDVDRLEPASKVDMDDCVRGLADGRYDCVQLFEPYVSQALAAGGFLWWSGAARGASLYTTLFARRRFLSERPAVAAALVSAVTQAQRLLHEAPAETVAGFVADDFPQLARSVLVSSVERYRRLGVWSRSPAHELTGFARLKCAAIAGEWIDRDLPFHTCLTNEFA